MPMLIAAEVDRGQLTKLIETPIVHSESRLCTVRVGVAEKYALSKKLGQAGESNLSRENRNHACDSTSFECGAADAAGAMLPDRRRTIAWSFVTKRVHFPAGYIDAHLVRKNGDRAEKLCAGHKALTARRPSIAL